jgi:hypothetical protein
MSAAIAPSLDVTAVRTRLLESTKNTDAEGAVAGYQTGRRWASEDADYRELYRLSCFEGDLKAMPVANAIDPFGEYGDYVDFWGSVFGDEFDWSEFLINPQILAGFYKGALEVWNEVNAGGAL